MRTRAASWIPALLSGLLIGGAVAARVPEAAGHEACDSCHASDNPAEALADGRICQDCHLPAALQPAPPAGDAPGHYRSGSATAGAMHCLTCHDPHALDHDGRIRQVAPGDRPAGRTLDARSRLCVQCHASHATFGERPYSRHPVGIPLPGGLRSSVDRALAPLADVAGTDDRGDDVIACTTCHTVHERRERHLLRWRGRDGMIAGCTACHDLGGAPLAGRRVSARP